MARGLGIACALLVTACRDAPIGTAASAPPAPDAAPRASTDASSEASGVTSPPDASAASVPRALVIPPHEAEWCIEGLTALDDETCVAVPSTPLRSPAEVLFYFHGITPPLKESAQKTTVQTTVKNASIRAGVVGVVPRGRRGIGPADAKDWWAWPTSSDAHAKLAREIVDTMKRVKSRLEALAGITFERTYLAGSSNGAYFLTALALRGDLERFDLAVDGVGAMSGGGTGGVPVSALADKKPVPIYVGFGTHDDETKKNAAGLVTLLTTARWPHKRAEHAVGHGAREIYLDEAFAFFRSPR